MIEDNKEYEELLKKIDDIELVSEEQLKDMDFYELAYYMQTLNQISTLDNNNVKEEDE